MPYCSHEASDLKSVGQICVVTTVASKQLLRCMRRTSQREVPRAQELVIELWQGFTEINLFSY